LPCRDAALALLADAALPSGAIAGDAVIPASAADGGALAQPTAAPTINLSLNASGAMGAQTGLGSSRQRAFFWRT
jgi:hypothetical protein